MTDGSVPHDLWPRDDGQRASARAAPRDWQACAQGRVRRQGKSVHHLAGL